MINLKLRDEIQNVYLFIHLSTDKYLPFLSMMAELKENQSSTAKISLSIPNKRK